MSEKNKATSQHVLPLNSICPRKTLLGVEIDCGIYFFKIVCQFSTTVKGTEALCATGTPIRKRLPSAVTSPPIKPAGNWKRGLGTPAVNIGLALMSTDISFPSEAT